MKKYFIFLLTIMFFTQCTNLNNQMKKPSFDVKVNDSNFIVTMHGGGNAAIYYTTDGSLPDTDSLRYVDRITFDSAVKIKAICFCASGRKSAISEISLKNIKKDVTSDEVYCNKQF